MDDPFEQYGAEIQESLAIEAAIDDFKSERLASFYLNSGLDPSPLAARGKAKALQSVDETASFLFAAIACECATRSWFVRPLVSGFVHSEPGAEFFVEIMLVDGRSSLRQFYKLLRHVLLHATGIDLASYARSEGAPPLWKELAEVATLRNSVLHRGEEVRAEDAERAITIFEAWEKLFLMLLDGLGLQEYSSGAVNWKGHVPPPRARLPLPD